MSETQSGARNEQTARDINTLGAFCGRRDLPALTRSAVRQAITFIDSDVIGSIEKNVAYMRISPNEGE